MGELIPFAAIDMADTPFSRAGQAALLSAAIELADRGLTQEQVMAELARLYPGKPTENHYLNPAAEAVMRRARREQLRAVGRQADLARLRAKGLPERLADKDEAPVPRPDYTDSDTDPAWRGPLHVEVQACKTLRDLLALCGRYDLQIRYDAESGKLVFNHRIADDSALFSALKRHKNAIIEFLVAADGLLV